VSAVGLTVRSLTEFFRSTILTGANLRGLTGVAVLLAVMEVAGPLGIPLLEKVPRFSAVVDRFIEPEGLLWREKYWMSWSVSLMRIGAAFVAGVLVGVPTGLLWGSSRRLKALGFPVFEMFRPISPLAYLPVAIILLPGIEVSIIAIIFLGTFFAVVINAINGVFQVDLSYQRAALSLGASRRDIFFRIILPGTLPSITTGATIGMGISWIELVAAEMIAGRAGLGYLTWESYLVGDIPQVMAGMASMGLGGAVSCAVIWHTGRLLTPWLEDYRGR